MKTLYVITPELRVILKEPFGDLIEGAVDITMEIVKGWISGQKPPLLVSVGDVVSKNLHQYGLHPLISIIDNISLRNQSVVPTEAHGEETIKVKNPQGTITKEAVDAVKEAIKRKKHVHIVVEGEEDLLTLIAIVYAPENAFIIYGQPHCGIVVAKATPERKAMTDRYLNDMKPRKAK
jgi:GTP-dependent dephospho-CoA kinase